MGVVSEFEINSLHITRKNGLLICFKPHLTIVRFSKLRISITSPMVARATRSINFLWISPPYNASYAVINLCVTPAPQRYLFCIGLSSCWLLITHTSLYTIHCLLNSWWSVMSTGISQLFAKYDDSMTSFVPASGIHNNDILYSSSSKICNCSKISLLNPCCLPLWNKIIISCVDNP